MRDVLGPLRRRLGTAILPFQYRRLPGARRVLVEACPSSTLKRLGLPHQNYKQPAGGALTERRRVTRRHLLDGLAPVVSVSPSQRRVLMRNPGGDAIDAVVAAVGVSQAGSPGTRDTRARGGSTSEAVSGASSGPRRR